MKKFDTLQELVAAVTIGDLDESALLVIQDNDCSHIYYGPQEDDDGEEIDNCIYRGKGYYDTDDLWKLVLPKAIIDWC